MLQRVYGQLNSCGMNPRLFPPPLTGRDNKVAAARRAIVSTSRTNPANAHHTDANSPSHTIPAYNSHSLLTTRLSWCCFLRFDFNVTHLTHALFCSPPLCPFILPARPPLKVPPSHLSSFPLPALLIIYIYFSYTLCLLFPLQQADNM